jgi:DNA-binding XRE family transcriptional regulator
MARNGEAGATRTVRRDRDAADTIRRLRTDRGLSRRDLSYAVREHGVRAGFDAGRVSVSEETIYLIETTYREPGPRIKFALALFFDRRPGQIWKRDALGDVRVAA